MGKFYFHYLSVIFDTKMTDDTNVDISSLTLEICVKLAELDLELSEGKCRHIISLLFLKIKIYYIITVTRYLVILSSKLLNTNYFVS